jgi:hypothetical protein
MSGAVATGIGSIPDLAVRCVSRVLSEAASSPAVDSLAGLTIRAADLVATAEADVARLLAPMVTSQPWYDTVATIATIVAALGAIGAIIVGIFTIRQRADADARSQWWSRVQWAVDLTFEEDRSRRTVGFEALALLARSRLARRGDAEFLRGLTLGVLDGVHERGEGPFTLDEPVAEPVDRVTSQSHRILVGRDEVAAARLRSIADSVQGVPTPAWVEELARTTA